MINNRELFADVLDGLTLAFGRRGRLRGSISFHVVDGDDDDHSGDGDDALIAYVVPDDDDFAEVLPASHEDNRFSLRVGHLDITITPDQAGDVAAGFVACGVVPTDAALAEAHDRFAESGMHSAVWRARVAVMKRARAEGREIDDDVRAEADAAEAAVRSLLSIHADTSDEDF